MNVITYLLESRAAVALGWTLFHFCWQGCVVALATSVLLRTMRSAQANARYLVTCFAFVLMGAVFITTFAINVTRPIATDSTVVERSRDSGNSLAAAVDGDLSNPAHSDLPAVKAGNGVEIVTDPTHLPETEAAAPNPAVPLVEAVRQLLQNSFSVARPWLVAFWLVGVFLLSMRMLLNRLSVRRLRTTGVIAIVDQRKNTLLRIADSMGMRHAVQLAESTLVEVPTVIGWLRPVILLPATAITGLTESQLTALLAHELAHVRRADYLVNLIQCVMETLLFFHPAVWWLSARIREEREHCCDDLASNWCGDARQYASALLQMEQLRAASGRIAMSARGGSLFNRIARLIHAADRCETGGSDSRGRESDRRHRSLSLAALISFSVAGLFIAMPLFDYIGGQSTPVTANEFTIEEDQKPQTDELQADEPAGTAETVVNQVPEDVPTVTITVSGRAIDADGKPIEGATIYIASHEEFHQLLKTTVSDSSGRYAFRDLRLPIELAEKRGFGTDIDSGRFELYGTAPGYAFTWRPYKNYYPDLKGNTIMSRRLDAPHYFEKDEKIDLDLTFQRPASLGGVIVDTKGNPISKAEVQIWKCWYAPTEEHDDSDMFQIGMHSIYSDDYCPKEISTVLTDEAGKFSFPHAPPETRFWLSIHPPGFSGKGAVATTEADPRAKRKGKLLKRDGMRLEFVTTRSVQIQVTGFDKPEHRKGTFVNPHSKFGSDVFKTGEDGLATVSLPPGKYPVAILPPTGTPYMYTDSQEIVVTNEPEQRFEVKMARAGVVDVQVIDVEDESGMGLAGFDFWVENEYPQPDGTVHKQRDIHTFRSYEQATRIAHVHRKLTDGDGRLRANFEPGSYLIGIGLERRPAGWEVLDRGGILVDLQPGPPRKVTFRVRRKSASE